jgi:REP element-mobilizing transposase RayT
MTQPRYVTPGATYLITRRCYQRTFRLRPSPLTNDVLRYCLALALHKTGVVLHAVCFMSNHHHMVVTDARGELPNFLREMHRSAAKALNASQSQWENLWSAEPCNVVHLVDLHDVVDKIAYVAANPVAEGLVERPEEWPGISMWNERTMQVLRPKMYFDERGPSPRELELRCVLPSEPSADERRASWIRRSLRDVLAAKIAEAHRHVHSARRRFLGRAAVLSKSFTERAHSYERRRATVPSVAAKDPRSWSAMLARLRAFRHAYRSVLEDWKHGARDAAFPYGTWWMRVHHGAACEPTSALAPSA